MALNSIYSEQGFPPPYNHTQTIHLSGGNGSIWVIYPHWFCREISCCNSALSLLGWVDGAQFKFQPKATRSMI